MVELTIALFARFHVNGQREDIFLFFYQYTKIINELFSFKYHIKFDTLIGGSVVAQKLFFTCSFEKEQYNTCTTISYGLNFLPYPIKAPSSLMLSALGLNNPSV